MKVAAEPALHRWLEQNDKSQEWLVAEINRRRLAAGIAPKVQRSNLWRWLTGRQRINVDDATLIQQITDDHVFIALWSIHHRPQEEPPTAKRRPTVRSPACRTRARKAA